MKVRIGKNIPYALIISIGLHILLFLTLGALYRQKPDRHIEAGTAFDIAKIHLRTPPTSGEKASSYTAKTDGDD